MIIKYLTLLYYNILYYDLQIIIGNLNFHQMYILSFSILRWNDFI